MENPESLASFRLKVARAKHHFGELQASMGAFFGDPEAYSFIKESHLESGVYAFRLKLHRPIPAEQWSLMIGDCVHNARSALDHLFWALLCIQHPGAPPADHWNANFPIYKLLGSFLKKKKLTEELIGPEAAAIVERLQPYQIRNPEDAVLWFLHEADVKDKHRLLVPSLSLLHKGHCQTIARLPQVEFNLRSNLILQDRLHDGAVMATFVIEPPHSVVDVNLVQAQLGISIERGPGQVLSVEKALSAAIDEVESVPSQFPALTNL